MERKKKPAWIPVLVLLLLAAGVFGGILAYNDWYETSHVFVENAVYPKDAAVLDLRGTGISAAHYEALRQELPDCDIRWDIPFQGGFLADDTTELTVSSLSAEDVAALDYLPGLKTVNAAGCRDYSQLLALQARHPDCDVRYTVTILDAEYPHDTKSLYFSDREPEAGELVEAMAYLPALESVHFTEPSMAAADLLALREQYPDVAVTWEKEVLGTVYADDVTEFDFSGTALETVAELEAALEYFPSLEKLVLCDCGLDNETLAAYRDRVREQYKVVWSVKVRSLTIRTDDIWFMPTKFKVEVTDTHMKDLIYCEDMICVDVGHMMVRNLDWVTGMPHLKYLIIADTWVDDISALSGLTELIYLEIFKTNVKDYSPLLGCTALEDINLAQTYGDPTVFAQMPWLKNLWINNCGVTAEERQLLTQSLPDTTIEFDHGWNFGNGWREVPNYFDMRDILGMPYYNWGNEETE